MCTILNTHGLTIRFTAVHGLPGLLNRGQYGIIGDGWLGRDSRCLGIEADLVGLDTCTRKKERESRNIWRKDLELKAYLQVSSGLARQPRSSRRSS